MCGSVRMSNECVKTGGPNKRTDGHGSILQRNELCSVCVVLMVNPREREGLCAARWVYARERLERPKRN